MENEFVFGDGKLSEFDEICRQVRHLIKSGKSMRLEFVELDKSSSSWLRDAIINNRKIKKITQSDIALYLSIDRKRISDFENGGKAPAEWGALIRKCGVRLTHPNFAMMTFVGVPYGTAANMARFKSKESIKNIAIGSGITQKKYREFEKGTDITFEETERVLGYLGFTTL